MIQKLISFFIMNRDSKWYEKHPTIQARFEEIEDWLEHIEDRVAALEEIAHPKCGIESFDGYKPLTERIDKLECIVGILKKESDDR